MYLERKIRVASIEAFGLQRDESKNLTKEKRCKRARIA